MITNNRMSQLIEYFNVAIYNGLHKLQMAVVFVGV